MACRVFIALCVSLAAISSSGCDDGNRTRIGPSSVSSRARFVSSSVSVQSTEITAVPSPVSFCPFISPFFAPFTLVISADSVAAVQLQQVQMQFVDSFGIGEGFRTINTNELSSLFGSTIVPAFGTRAFPFQMPFGCAGGPAGVVNVIAVTESDGRAGNVSLRMHVR